LRAKKADEGFKDEIQGVLEEIMPLVRKALA
jgi:hypothetical protein